MNDVHKVVHEIVALVDECPSEPFSYERRQVEDKIYLMICKHTQQVEDDEDAAFRIGLEEGESQGYNEAKDEYETRIQELEDEIAELKEEMEQKINDATAEGYEAARIEYGLN